MEQQTTPIVHESGETNRLLGVCPIMSVRQIFAMEAPALPTMHEGKIIDIPAPRQITLTPVDAVVYCQGTKCHFFRQDVQGCTIHLLANLRTIADSVLPAKSYTYPSNSILEKLLTKITELIDAMVIISKSKKKKAPPDPASGPGQADQVK